jgi:hypothetical protein
MVGASGAAFGILVAFGMILWDTRVMALIAMVFPVRLRARMLVLGAVIMEIVLFVASLFVPEDKDVFLINGVAHMAHLGGALFGYYYCKMLGFGGGKLSMTSVWGGVSEALATCCACAFSAIRRSFLAQRKVERVAMRCAHASSGPRPA